MPTVFIFRLVPLNLKICVHYERPALRRAVKFCAFNQNLVFLSNCGIFKFADRIYGQILSSSLAKFTAEKQNHL